MGFSLLHSGNPQGPFVRSRKKRRCSKGGGAGGRDSSRFKISKGGRVRLLSLKKEIGVQERKAPWGLRPWRQMDQRGPWQVLLARHATSLTAVVVGRGLQKSSLGKHQE